MVFDPTKWADENAQYIKFGEGESVTCKYLRAEPFVDKENEDRPKVRYYLEVGGREKIFESQSLGLANQMGPEFCGKWLSIKRTGKGKGTRYEVTVEKDPGV